MTAAHPILTVSIAWLVPLAFPHVDGDWSAINHGFYPGTRTPIRVAPADTLVHVDLTTGSVTDDVGGWVADRIGSLGARQLRAVKAAL